MVMGASTSCADFENVSNALQWIITVKFGVKHMSHILDDFIFFSPSKDTCAQYQSKFHFLCKDLNLPIKHSKTVQASQIVELHGLQVNTVNIIIIIIIQFLYSAYITDIAHSA
jgi:hypothetical protein